MYTEITYLRSQQDPLAPDPVVLVERSDESQGEGPWSETRMKSRRRNALS